ncbi:PPE domain-containing protein [Actinosynnema pretiosum]|uniref:PPE domain-containing protein n=1 Tax=Actinosynnema pretiosum TaxID=42197 RepID=UPI0012FD9B19|nr:PPE domain-containing protein [Actinosynnema pretiosum]
MSAHQGVDVAENDQGTAGQGGQNTAHALPTMTDIRQENAADAHVQMQTSTSANPLSRAVEAASIVVKMEVDSRTQFEQQRRELGAQIQDTRPPMTPDGTNYMSYEHSALQQMVTEGMDPASARGQVDAWNQVGTTLVTLQDNLRGATAASKDAWQGEAAESARSYFGSVTDWSTNAAQSAQYTSAQMQSQVDAAESAKSKMPEPVQFSTADATKMLLAEPNPLNWGGTISEIKQKFAEKQEAHVKAAETMTAMSSTFAETGATMPAFVAPPPMSGSDSGSSDSGDRTSISSRPDSSVGSGIGTGTGRIGGVGTGNSGTYVYDGGPNGGGTTGTGTGNGGGSGSGGSNNSGGNTNQSGVTYPGGGGTGGGTGGGGTGGGGIGGGGTGGGYVPPGGVGYLPPGGTGTGGTGTGSGGLGGGRGGLGGGTGAGGLGGRGGAGGLSGGPGGLAAAGGRAGGFGGGASGFGGGAGGFGAGGSGVGGSGLGAGGSSSALGEGGRSGVGGYGSGGAGGLGGVAAGRGGAAAGGMGAGGMGAAGGRGNGEEDKEHKTASYLQETEDVFGDGTLVAPPVIGG